MAVTEAEANGTRVQEHDLLMLAQDEITYSAREWQTVDGKAACGLVASAAVALATELRIRRCM